MMDIQTEKDSHVGALFPRVHVSETRVPGPRAPPRNKMALFEQFTIPPHRFVPPIVQESSQKVNSQGGGQDINSALLKPKQVKRGELSDVSCRKAKREASRCSVAELCVYSETSKSSAACDLGNKDCGLLPLRNLSPPTPSTVMQKIWNRSAEESGIAGVAHLPSTDTRTQNSTVESRPTSSSVERMVMPPCGWAGIGAGDTDTLDALHGAIAENHPYNLPGATYGNGVAPSKLLARSAASSERFSGISLMNEAHIPQGFLQVEKITDEGFRGCIGTNDTGSSVQQMVCSDRSSEVAGVTGQDKPTILIEKCDVNRWYLDSLPRIIPKQVIEVIGQREFWEARTTMLKQQKTLSTQVFELHRLIEVQRLIAAMPGHLLEGKDRCFVVKSSAQPEVTELSNKLVIRQSLDKDAKHCAKPKQAGVKGPKKPLKLSSGVGNTTANGKCQNPSLQVFPLKPICVSLDHGRVSTWGIRPTWLKAESQNYGLCRGGPMAFGPPTSGHLYNEQQVLQDGSITFTNWSKPCNVLPKFIPEVYNPPLACQTLVNGSLIHQLGCALGAQTSACLSTPNQVTPVLKKSSYSTLSPSSRAPCDTPNINSQQETHGQEKQQSSGCQKLASQSKKSTGDLDASHRAESMSAAGLHEFQSERSGLGFQTFGTPISSRGNGNETFAMVEDTIAVTESYVAHRNNPLFQVSLENVSSVQKGEKNGVTKTSKVIRAVPHPASEAVQAAAKILKSIQQSDLIQEGGYG